MNLGDLNEYLFRQLENLEKQKDPENTKLEIEKAKVVTQVADKIIGNGRLALEVMKFQDNKWDADQRIPEALMIETEVESVEDKKK